MTALAVVLVGIQMYIAAMFICSRLTRIGTALERIAEEARNARIEMEHDDALRRIG